MMSTNGTDGLPARMSHGMTLRLDVAAANEVGRLLNGAGNPEEAAIGHLATVACRAAESLVYLADIDDARFGGEWVQDAYPNDVVDDAHVRWAASTALTSLDLCTAAAARLGGFRTNVGDEEASVRTYYSDRRDRRDAVPAPWRRWLDDVVTDARYGTLLAVRHALVHRDALRVIGATTGPIEGHSLRYGFNIGPLAPPVSAATHRNVSAREVVEKSRDMGMQHATAFVTVLQSIPR